MNSKRALSLFSKLPETISLKELFYYSAPWKTPRNCNTVTPLIFGMNGFHSRKID